MRVLVFDIDGQRFGLDASGVREVLPAATLTVLPNLPPAIEGVLDVRGVVVPVIAMRSALGLDPRPLRSTDHLVIASSQGRAVGLHVDHAIEIIDVDDVDTETCSTAMDGTESVARIARLDGGLMSVHIVDAIVGDWVLKTPQSIPAFIQAEPVSDTTVKDDSHAVE